MRWDESPKFLLIASIGLAANPSLYKKLAFEPQTDLEPITLIASLTLGRWYELAFRTLGVREFRRVEAEQAVARGLWKIARGLLSN